MARHLNQWQRAARTRAANKRARENAARQKLHDRLAESAGDTNSRIQAQREAYNYACDEQMNKEIRDAGKLRTVTVEFSNGAFNRYAYLTRDDEITKGDFVVVISPYGNDNATRWRSELVDGYVTLVKVTSVVETAESITKASKWIVQRIDLTEVAARIAHQKQLATLDARIERAKAKALKDLELQTLRDLSPELNYLIDCRNALTK